MSIERESSLSFSIYNSYTDSSYYEELSSIFKYFKIFLFNFLFLPSLVYREASFIFIGDLTLFARGGTINVL